MGITSLRDNVVYQQLQKQLPASRVKHNFFKYLVDRNGMAVKMYTKKQDPFSFEKDIDELLKKTDTDASADVSND